MNAETTPTTDATAMSTTRQRRERGVLTAVAADDADAEVADSCVVLTLCLSIKSMESKGERASALSCPFNPVVSPGTGLTVRLGITRYVLSVGLQALLRFPNLTTPAACLVAFVRHRLLVVHGMRNETSRVTSKPTQ